MKVSAPGKLVIAGEYAVLEGHAALVTAVDRRAVVEVTDADRLSLARGGMTPQIPVAFERAKGQPQLELLVRLVEEAERRKIPFPDAALSLDTDAFFEDGGDKLGLGSSAAGTVALAAVFLAHASGREVRELDPRAIFDLALAAHTRFNQGGSGVDLAASTWGGTFVFRRQDDRVGVTEAKLVPEGVDLLFVHSGKAQKTSGFLKAVAQLKATNPQLYGDLIHAIADAARIVIDAWTPDELLVGFKKSREAMAALGEAAVIAVVSPLHDGIAKVATRFGAEAKPSGAGGGDFALVAAPEGNRRELMTALSQAGYPTIELTPSADGVRQD